MLHEHMLEGARFWFSHADLVGKIHVIKTIDELWIELLFSHLTLCSLEKRTILFLQVRTKLTLGGVPSTLTVPGSKF